MNELAEEDIQSGEGQYLRRAGRDKRQMVLTGASWPEQNKQSTFFQSRNLRSWRVRAVIVGNGDCRIQAAITGGTRINPASPGTRAVCQTGLYHLLILAPHAFVLPILTLYVQKFTWPSSLATLPCCNRSWSPVFSFTTQLYT